jgi:hypothetical protein
VVLFGDVVALPDVRLVHGLVGHYEDMGGMGSEVIEVVALWGGE